MKTSYIAVGGALVLAAAGFAWHLAAPAHLAPASGAAPAAQETVRRPATPGRIVFAADDPQLSYLKVAGLEGQSLPVAEPVAGRIAYDEGRTSRVASPVLGRVTAARVEVGDTVRAGQPLADLDSPDLAGAQADALKASADQERKRLALDRARTLVDADVLARKDYEDARADYRAADAEARRARQRIGNLHAEKSGDGRFALIAPITGIVADKQINVGMEVRPDQANPLFVISDLRRVWAIADVPEAVAVKLRRGQAVDVKTDAYPGQAFHGTVERIGVAVDPATRRIQVRASLDNADGKLKPDMFARIAFVARDNAAGDADAGAAKALPVPNTALVTEGLATYVFVETTRGTFEKRRVHVALGGAATSWIDDGLAARERVVTEGALLLNAEGANHAG
jgi:cobalt-zinc-cadmium efflux system membrane fusion protein